MGEKTIMNSTSINFDQVIELALQEKVPVEKKRGIIREYLQAKLITFLYQIPESNSLLFVGGTSLRLLRNLNRFSEDLDFDNLDLSNENIEDLVDKCVTRMHAENIDVETKNNKSKGKYYFELRFPQLLSQLDISTNPKEKLMIKVDYANHWKGQQPETILLRKYGMLEQVVTNPINQMLVQKLAAYVDRDTLQPRDIYDVVWLYANKAKLDKNFMRDNGLESLLEKAKNKLREKPVNQMMKRKLSPFLFNEADVSKLDMFGDVLNKL